MSGDAPASYVPPQSAAAPLSADTDPAAAAQRLIAGFTTVPPRPSDDELKKLPAEFRDRCDQVVCGPQQTVIARGRKSDFGYACSSKELADYTNYVVGLVAIQAAVGAAANINPQTGDIESSGATGLIQTLLRERAGVATFDDALSKCLIVNRTVRLKIANDGGNSTNAWAAPASVGAAPMWYPKILLHLARH